MPFRSSCLSNLRFRTQVMLYQVTICTIIMLIFMIISFKHLTLIQSIFEDSSKIMLLCQYSKGINLIQALNSQTISGVMKRNKQLLYNVQQLYYFSTSQNPSIEQPLDCLTNLNYQNMYAFNFTQCYGLFSQEKIIEINDKQLMNFSALVTQSMLMLDRNPDSILSVVTLRNSTYYALIPGSSLKNYNPHIRSWYLNQVSLDFSHETQFSQPYRLLTNDQYSLTQTMYLQNSNSFWEGILSSEVKFQQFQSLVAIQPILNLQLIGNNGIIYLDQNPNNINTTIDSQIQNMYGGNIQILQFIQQVIYSQSNDSINNQAQIIFLNDTFFIINNIKTTKIFLFQSINVRERIIKSQRMIAQQIDKMNSQIEFWIIISIFLGVSLIVASIILIILITQPINNTIYFINSKINPLKMYILCKFQRSNKILTGLQIFKQSYINFNKKLTDSSRLKHQLLEDNFHTKGQQSLAYEKFIFRISQIVFYSVIRNTIDAELKQQILKIINQKLELI